MMGTGRTRRTGQFLVREVGRLSRNGIPFIAISGNHDARSVITRQLRLPEPAHQMKATKAETWLLPDLDVAIHGQSFATPAVLEDLTKNYPLPRPGSFDIGLLHTNVNGQSGHRELRAFEPDRPAQPWLRLLGPRACPFTDNSQRRPLDRLSRQPPRSPRPRNRRQGRNADHRLHGRPRERASGVPPLRHRTVGTRCGWT